MKTEDLMDNYAGKKAVVTGGTIGMGLATVKALLERGVEVLLTGRNEQRLDAARGELGPRAHVVRSDTASLADIDALGGIVEEKFGQVDFVFINAGISELAPFDQVTEACTTDNSTSTRSVRNIQARSPRARGKCCPCGKRCRPRLCS
jgi:NAD(P)-dependent dehydrogenase (short-subunit alcohol dehydrogenase family)